MADWTAFRPTPQDLERLGDDVAGIDAIQRTLVANHDDVRQPDRVAHQYQIAGGKVTLKIAQRLPARLEGVGLFQPGAEYTGIGRVSTGLGCPHLETDPDFLGLMLAFQTAAGKRVDFLAINHPAAPTDTHPEFMSLLEATAQGAGAEPPFGSGAGELDLFDLLASNLKVVRSLVNALGVKRGGGIALHVLGQTLRTTKSSSACQTYWTGVVELGGWPGKFSIVPRAAGNKHRALRPGARHLSDQWRALQAAGPVQFDLFWLPFVDNRRTSLVDLTDAWEERPEPVAELEFPRVGHADAQAQAWSSLAAEMGANPGNWVSDRDDSTTEPGTEFTCARKLAYTRSQQGRDVLPASAYADVFVTGEIDAGLLAELQRRRAQKRDAGHLDMAP